jgi:hypothetical protein
MSAVQLVKYWLWIGVITSLAGWSLSAIEQLNRGGYCVFFAAAVAAIFLGRKQLDLSCALKGWNWKKISRRFRRPLPLTFALLTLLIFAGGLMYPPSNHTAMTYRIPRVLNWLAESNWFWIHTADPRMNDRACGIEWMATPLLLFTRSDRALFLLNFVPFLLLPGLLFSICVRLGVRARVAWHWMWLLPTGYSFLLQAGSAGNDTFPAVYLLAAVDFGLRAWSSRRIADVWHSILAAALLTGAKATNLPLLLPWAIVLFPLLPLLRRKLLATVSVVLIAAVISFLPTAVLNHVYCGDWTGAIIEPAHMTMSNPVTGIWGNTFQILLNNFVPPFFPQAQWWNQNAARILPEPFVSAVQKNFDIGYFQIGELPTEDWAGWGFGLSMLLTASLIAALRLRGRRKSDHESKFPVPPMVRRLVLLAPWVALLVYCAKSGMVTAARLISPYYTLLLPALILGAGHAQVVRRRWWRAAMWSSVMLAAAVLILTPPRPLWPAQTILSSALEAKPGNRLLTRALKVYSVYGTRSDPLAVLRPMLPPNTSVIGFVGTGDDIDISLWRPFFTRRVQHVLIEDSPETIRELKVRHAVVSGLALKEKNISLDSWLQEKQATLLATTNAIVKVADGPQPWHIVRFEHGN